MNLRDEKSAGKRREKLEQELNIQLPNTGKFSLDENMASAKNCENMIGITQIPLGVAGPLKIQSSKFKVQNFYIPLATTEGALVASVNRGCKAITESGGAVVSSYRAGTSRGPVFATGNIKNGQNLEQWATANAEKLKKTAQETSKHISLENIMVRILPNYAFVRLSFNTQDAMGMNMVTIATEKLVQLIEKETGISCISVAGNFDNDKKASWLNIIENRGFKVWAEVTISKKILESVLKTSAQKIYDVWLAKNMLGSAMSGSMSFNAHFANIVAALFIATGQDPAHVVEGSLGITTAEVRDQDLYFSVYLPDLMLGTVGGGTNLATQKEALSILGLSGGNNGKNSEQFAEIVAAAVLSGELSLLASLSAGTLASSHQKLAR